MLTPTGTSRQRAGKTLGNSVLQRAHSTAGGRVPLTVGVVIPCYNYGHFLLDAVDSVQSQTHPADAILVVDDGSTDDTTAVAQTLDCAVRYLRIDHGGQSAARNVGARSIETDLIVFLDADDRLDPCFLESCIAALPESWRYYFVYTHFRRLGASDTLWTAPAYDRSQLLRENYIHSAALLPREEIVRIGYDESLKGLEDWDLYLTLAERGIEGILVDAPLLLYRVHDRGVTRNLRRRPLRLAALRTRILVKHRRLYRAGKALRQVWSIIVLVVKDSQERYQLDRRWRKVGRLMAQLPRRVQNSR